MCSRTEMLRRSVAEERQADEADGVNVKFTERLRLLARDVAAAHS